MRDLLSQDLTESASQAMNGDLQRAFRCAEVVGELPVGDSLVVSDEVGLQPIELIRLAADTSENLIDHRQRPLLFEDFLGREVRSRFQTESTLSRPNRIIE